MLKRCLMMSASLVLVAVVAVTASAQAINLAPLVGKSTFTPEDTALLQGMIQNDVRTIAASERAGDVRTARDRMARLPQQPGATLEFRQLTARLILTEVEEKLDTARDHRNRLALAITVARLQSPEAIEIMLKMLGDRFASVRYWAAQGLAVEPVTQAILRGGEGLPTTRAVLVRIQAALDAEPDAVVTESLFGLLQGIRTDLATDILVEQSQKKAVAFDLARVDAVNAMRRAATALQAAHGREIRPEAEGKRPIVAALGQILIQTPPHGVSLELVEQLSETLTALTGQKSEIAGAIRDYRAQSTIRDSKLVDLIWVQQLSWIQQLKLNGQVTLLDWSPQKSVDVTRSMTRL